MSNLEKQCSRVLAGEITFTAFVHTTRVEFHRLANQLASRWTPPSWMVVDDLVQELYYGAWSTLFGRHPWDPSRGVPISRYVVFNAMSHAKRALHKARGAKLSGSPDRNPSRIERPLSAFKRSAGEGEGALLSLLISDEPSAEQALIAGEMREEAVDRALELCTSARERVAVIALEMGGDLDGAAHVLYDDRATRTALGLGSRVGAIRYVARAAGDVVKRLDADAS